MRARAYAHSHVRAYSQIAATFDQCYVAGTNVGIADKGTPFYVYRELVRLPGANTIPRVVQKVTA